jgi:hypothetical protein
VLGFTASVSIPCQTQANYIHVATLTPPPGTIAGYLVAACNTPSIFRQREIQLWLPPSNPGNQGGTYLQSAFSNANGYFEFRGISPCIVYELKIVQGSVVTVVNGIVAGASTTKYIISDATGAICNVIQGGP